MFLMGDINSAPRNFTQDFVIGDQKVSVEFIRVNDQKKQLYQVWVPVDGKKVRIHLQLTENDDFRITLPEACPKSYQKLEKAFSTAIVES
jgi:hypothetical protein